MSTTFDIFPSKKAKPSFEQVLKSCQANYHAHLEKQKIYAKPNIAFKLLQTSTDSLVNYNPKSEFMWKENVYLWVTVEGISGGTDGYFNINEEMDYDYWNDDIIPGQHSETFKLFLRQCLSPGYHWYFRRSAGQPGVINILYGVLSGTLAELTHGVVFSDDSAWDYERMPILGNKFLKNYLIPEREQGIENKKWALKCIKWAREELGA